MAITSQPIKCISCLEPPIMLNGWKHHMGFLLNEIRKWSAKAEPIFPLFAAKLQVLGDSQFDMYTGSLQPETIANDLSETLMGFRAFDKEGYIRWVESSNHLFWQLEISDGSEWTMRINDPNEDANENYYIHIHPSRHSKYSRRIKGNHLRTALATLILANMRGEKPGLPLMNQVRKDFLGLSTISKPLAKEIFATLNYIASEAGVDH